ncbi:hypothetical protein THRCLA_10684 [Thraustotheca clavata]|uniref:Uncharacterized protein n=1 Tax=Thraustotheca clavata TaxID=74557 RepID=A0A1V9YII6_9STRA|nr:hypothetical protein THRCLA_10684 [Thraustotheca clavata]
MSGYYVAVKLILSSQQRIIDTNRLRYGLLGVRGYLLPFISAISMLFDIRSNATRNVDIQQLFLINIPQATIGLVGFTLTLRIWCYLSLLFVCCCIRAVQYRTKVPHCTLSFCNHTMFSTSWNTLLFTLSRNTDQLSTIPYRQITRRCHGLLLNILWMTDPIECLLMIWTSSCVFRYCHKQTKLRIHHPLAPQDLERLEEFNHLKEEYDCEDSIKFNSLSWRERIE